MSNSHGEIKNIIFIRQGGLLLFSLSNPEGRMEIISSFLEAIKTFSSEIEDLGEIRSINLSKVSLSYYCKNPNFYIIIIHDSDIPIKALIDLFEKINYEFLNRYSEDIIINWDHDVSKFRPFIEVLREKIDNFNSQHLTRQKEELYESIEKLANESFKDETILAISKIDSTGAINQTHINTSLNDFELQVFMSSPYYDKIIRVLGSMLTSIGNFLLNTSDVYHIIKSKRFCLGIKQMDSNYISILGLDYDKVKNIIIKV
ncbi:MAG: hypothetical protein ACTSPY_12700 [Candidatus Helarchaeota archaeon]